MSTRIFFISLMVIFAFSNCQKTDQNYSSAAQSTHFFHASMDTFTDIIIYDIFSPPVASRNYAYPSIAAYEVIRHDTSGYRSLAGQLKGLSPIPKPDTKKTYCFPLAANQAFLEAGRAFIFSEAKLLDYEKNMLQKYRDIGVPKQIFNNSVAYGKKVAAHILAWADGDNYKQSRSFPKYNVNDDPATWKPTPPAYMDGIEPHWRDIRPFVLDSATQFVPAPPTDFDMDRNSTFFAETMEVYEAVANADNEHIEIAKFWDCNPFVMNVTGHVMHATKKITPGGHWMSIASIASRESGASIHETLKAYAWVSVALADGFISCWDEKYRSNLTRPETVINEYIDEDWIPILQTPPFPEHTSGHSVISSAAAVVLTKIYGDDFAFDDDSEVRYGLPVRSFDSFLAASEEAAVSRLYGGIHYRPAIDAGVDQGRQVGRFVANNLKFSE